jgi:hypothetical protein
MPLKARTPFSAFVEPEIRPLSMRIGSEMAAETSAGQTAMAHAERRVVSRIANLAKVKIASPARYHTVQRGPIKE